ncbi:MAG: polyprenyl synthetase family protein, partial [Pseudomonadota bacterium]
MPSQDHLEKALKSALADAHSDDMPETLSKALEYTLFPGGARVRPNLCLAVANASGARDQSAAIAAAVALEFIHCASLVHDDLPIFDDADIRRGKPSVHKAFGEEIALLTGDTLIIKAFETLADASANNPLRGMALVRRLARYAGAPHGICAGQAWESEKVINLSRYHAAKTGALFIAATEMGAIATDQDPNDWYELGARIGEAYQIADDLRDALL